jgi:hypothetical protein
LGCLFSLRRGATKKFCPQASNLTNFLEKLKTHLAKVSIRWISQNLANAALNLRGARDLSLKPVKLPGLLGAEKQRILRVYARRIQEKPAKSKSIKSGVALHRL